MDSSLNKNDFIGSINCVQWETLEKTLPKLNSASEIWQRRFVICLRARPLRSLISGFYSITRSFIMNPTLDSPDQTEIAMTT